VSAAGYAIPPIPECAELKALIGRRWQMLPIHERELPENAPRPGIWLPRLQWERQNKLAVFAGPHVGRYNIVGRRVWWQNRDVDDVLREHGYVPLLVHRPSTSALCADVGDVAELVLGRAFCGALRALPTTSAQHRHRHPDADGSSSAPPRLEKKEEPEEEECLEETRPWWVADREMLAKLSRHPPHDPEDAPGLSLAIAHSLPGPEERQEGRPAAHWSSTSATATRTSSRT
jgi:hypothetical protein